jgi:UDP-glucose 4-epimerase
VLSSTCATYGEPQGRLTEDSPQLPVNPYGWSKLFAEQMVRDYAATEPRFSFALLRYFNVAGAAHDGTLGERHEPEPHLIPNLLRVARRDGFGAIVFGSDYPTPDGTCIRDYIHVDDVADAHIAVMRALVPGDRRVYNLGIGRGYSVLEVVEAVKRVTGAELNVQFGPRRPGDPAALYCVPWRIARELDWEAKTRTIDEIIETAWAYLRKQA